MARNLRVLHVGPVDLSVDPGECLCLSGPTGAGKTLTLRAIGDLDPHDGEVSLDGTDQRQVSGPEWRRRVGLLLAESYWWADTVGEHFDARSDAREDAKNAPASADLHRWLGTLGFEPAVFGWQINRLSSGERQRLALLRLLVGGPRALLLDEPTANLDVEMIALVEELIASYRREREAAVLWVSHDPAQRRRVADRELRIVNGRLVPLATGGGEPGNEEPGDRGASR